MGASPTRPTALPGYALLARFAKYRNKLQYPSESNPPAKQIRLDSICDAKEPIG